MVGLSLAYELAGRGQRVVVVDKQTPGREASWAGAGILPPGSWYSDHPSCVSLAAESWPLNAKWAAELRDSTGIDNEYQVGGGLYLPLDSEQALRLEQKFNLWASLGIEVQRLKNEQLRELVPSLSDAALTQVAEHGGYYVPGEAQLRNPLHLQALAAGCEQRGVRIGFPLDVASMAPQTDRSFHVSTSRGDCSAGRVVIAAGAWSGQVAELLGMELRSRPIRGQMVLFSPIDQPAMRNIHHGKNYLVRRRDGRTIAGTTVEDVGFDKSTTAQAIDEIVQWARRLSPALAEASIEKTWAGLRPASGDELPYLGTLPGVHNGFVATGFFRSGLQLASAAAVSLADLITAKTPSIDLHPLRVDR